MTSMQRIALTAVQRIADRPLARRDPKPAQQRSIPCSRPWPGAAMGLCALLTFGLGFPRAAHAAINVQLVNDLLVITDKPTGALTIEDNGGEIVVSDASVLEIFDANLIRTIQIELEAALNTVNILPVNLAVDITVLPDDEDKDAYDLTVRGGTLAGTLDFTGSKKADTVTLEDTLVQSVELRTGGGPDAVVIDGDVGFNSTDDLIVFTAGGDDVVTIGVGQTANIRATGDIELGSANDLLTGRGIYGAKLEIQAEQGNDSIEILEDAQLLQGLTVGLGADDDELTFSGLAEGVNVGAGAGDDVVTVTATAVVEKNLTVALEAGSDRFDFFGTVAKNLTAQAGDGEDDIVNLNEGSVIRGNADFRNGGKTGAKNFRVAGRIDKDLKCTGGKDNDVLTFLGTVGKNAKKIKLGNGDDLFLFAGDVAGTLKIDGQNDIDACVLDGGQAALVQLKNVEDVGDCLL